MIHIEQNQEVAGHPELRATVPTGDYDEIDLIECSHRDNLDRPLYMFQAQYVKFGSMVYQQDDVLTDKQVEMLLAGRAAGEVIGNKSLIDGFRRTNFRAGRIFGKQGMKQDAARPEPPQKTPEVVPAPEPKPQPEPKPEPESAPEIVPEPVDVSTTTPPVVLEPVDPVVTTSTPPVLPPPPPPPVIETKVDEVLLETVVPTTAAAKEVSFRATTKKVAAFPKKKKK